MKSKSEDKNNKKAILKKGESIHSAGGYQFRWVDDEGKRRSIHASTLAALREREAEIEKDLQDRIKPEARFLTVNDVYVLWKQIKRGLKDNTFQNYIYMYDQFVASNFGKKRISDLLKSDVKRFYNYLAEERCLSISTIDGIHNILHQILEMAVDDLLIRRNPADNVMKELKKIAALKAEKKRALTRTEQDIFLNYLKRTPQYQHWYPIFAVMIGTGMRVGEVTGLRWCDIDLEDEIIEVNHTLVYYKHAVNGCYYNVHSPKTESSIRQIPMLQFVKEAFQQERRNQFQAGIRCEARIDGYTDFIFVNRFGNVQHHATLNKALKRIIRDCNEAILAEGKQRPHLLPHFSCHTLRHTFTTRMCEAGMNVKVIQNALGHADVSTTLNIYADVTKSMKKKGFTDFEVFWQKSTNG